MGGGGGGDDDRPSRRGSHMSGVWGREKPRQAFPPQTYPLVSLKKTNATGSTISEVLHNNLFSHSFTTKWFEPFDT